MTERGGPTTQSGIFYQNSVATLYLGRLCDLTPRGDADRIVEVRVEAPTDVDDTVVTYANGQRKFIQAKENIRDNGTAWNELWKDFESQFWDPDFVKGRDRLLIHVGEPHDELYALKELCGRTVGSKDPAEWLTRLVEPQTKLLRKIKSLLDPGHAGDEEVHTFLSHVDVEVWTAEYIRRDLLPYWIPPSNKPQVELFRLLRDRVGETSRRRGSFTADALRTSLAAENGVRFTAQPSLEVLRETVKACGAGLRQHKHTFGGTGKHLQRGVVKDIVNWAQETTGGDKNVAMLVDQAGAGKTVVARDVLHALEKAGVQVLAVKADQLSGIGSAEELQAALRLPDNAERVVERLAATGTVVLLLDQIDALSLSLARDQKALDVVLEFIARARLVSGVRVLISCRIFDLHNDPRLKGIEIGRQFNIAELSREEVRDILNKVGVEFDRLASPTQQLLCTPLHLDLFTRAIGAQVGNGEEFYESHRMQSLQDLYALLWRNVIRKAAPQAPPVADREEAIVALTEFMHRAQRTSAPQSIFSAAHNKHLDPAVTWLASEGILIPSGNEWNFLHQTFFDYSYAKGFAEGGGNLHEAVSTGEQGLFARPQVIQVLGYLRGSNATAYLRELRNLLKDSRLRFHLRDLVLRWFGSLANPSDAEWLIARQMLANASQRAQLMAVMGGNRGWFERLKGDYIQDLLAGDEQTIDSLAMPYLTSMVGVAQDEVIRLIRPYLGRNAQWTRRVRNVLSSIRQWSTIEAAALFEQVFRLIPVSELKDVYEVDDVAKAYPQTGCRLIRVAFDRLIEDIPTQKKDGGLAGLYSVSSRLEAFNGSTMVEAFKVVTQAEPKLFLDLMLPWLEQALRATVHLEGGEHFYTSDDFSELWYGGHYVVQHELTEALIRALIEVARTAPEDFRLIAQRIAVQPFETFQRLLVHAYSALPEMYAADALQFLAGDSRRFDLGERDQYDTRKLLKAMYPFLSGEQRAELEGLILSYCPTYKHTGLDGLRSGARKQLHLFQSVPPQDLSERAHRRLSELERRFPGHRASDNPSTVYGGFVGSPIPGEATKRMSEKAWLRAMLKYRGHVTHKDPLKGGAQQLSTLLEARVKEDPQRFYQLALRVPADTDESYVRAFMNGLAESAAPTHFIAELARSFGRRSERDTKQAILWALAKRSKDGLPDDLIDWLESEVRGPAGSDEDWWLRQEREAANTQQRNTLNAGPYSSYLNSIRGAALRALMRSLDHKGGDEGRRRKWDMVEFVAGNASTALRAGAVEELVYLLGDDRERAVALFKRLMEGHPALLRSHFTAEFVYYGFYNNYFTLKPFILALMNESYENIQQRGAELACITALSSVALESAEAEADARELAGRTLTGPPSWRRGAARIYAHNIAIGTSAAVCTEGLTRLLDNDDDQVRRLIDEAFKSLKDEHFITLSDFIKAYAASRAFHDGGHRMAEYLWKRGELNPSLALSVVEIILNNKHKAEGPPYFRGGEELVRLVIRIHTSSLADETEREQAMNVFDKLMERFTFNALVVLQEWDQR